jgi:hypothetical protein
MTNQQVSEKIKQRLHQYCECTPETCYVLTMLARKKDNGELTERHKIEQTSRFIFSQDQEIDDMVDLVVAKAELCPDLKFRIQVSVNRRSLRKGLKEIQIRLLTISNDIMDGNFEAYATLANLHSEVKSIYCSRACRYEKRFLLDVDFDNKTAEGVDAFLDLIKKLKTCEKEDKTPVKVYISLATKNGFAIVSDPFDYRKFLEGVKNVDVKPDDGLMIGCLNDPDYRC